MITTVDRNKDGKISYSEFRWEILLSALYDEHTVYRVMMGGFPLIIPNDPAMKIKIEEKAISAIKKY